MHGGHDGEEHAAGGQSGAPGERDGSSDVEAVESAGARTSIWESELATDRTATLQMMPHHGRIQRVTASWTPHDAHHPASPADAAPHVAVVLAADGVRFVASGHSRDALRAQLAEYVASNVERLWAADGTRVRRLLARGDADAAVAHYFATVGSRWDEEWLMGDPTLS
jgi:hypothetical protein